MATKVSVNGVSNVRPILFSARVRLYHQGNTYFPEREKHITVCSNNKINDSKSYNFKFKFQFQIHVTSSPINPDVTLCCIMFWGREVERRGVFPPTFLKIIFYFTMMPLSEI